MVNYASVAFRLFGYLTFLVALLMLLFYIYSEGSKSGFNRATVECQVEKIQAQNQQSEIKDEKIKAIDQIQKRKVVNKKFSSSDNIEWLRKNRCKDCPSR